MKIIFGCQLTNIILRRLVSLMLKLLIDSQPKCVESQPRAGPTGLTDPLFWESRPTRTILQPAAPAPRLGLLPRVRIKEFVHYECLVDIHKTLSTHILTTISLFFIEAWMSGQGAQRYLPNNSGMPNAWKSSILCVRLNFPKSNQSDFSS